jgi:hypothetical protein
MIWKYFQEARLLAKATINPRSLKENVWMFGQPRGSPAQIYLLSICTWACDEDWG